MKIIKCSTTKKIALCMQITLILSACDDVEELSEESTTLVGTKTTEDPPVAEEDNSAMPAETLPETVKTIIETRAIIGYGEAIDQNHQTGGPNDIKLNPVTNLPAVAYYDKSLPASGTVTVGALKYASMDSSGAWAIQVIDQNFGTVACGTAASTCIGAPNALATGANIASIISLAFKPSGLPVVAYVYGSSAAASKLVKIAELSSAGTWTISNVPYTNFSTVNITNDPIKAVEIAIDSASRIHLTFAIYMATVTNSKLVYAFRDAALNWSIHEPVSIMTAGTLALGSGMNQGTIAFCPLDSSIYIGSTIITGASTSTVNLHKCITNSTGGCPSAGSWTTLSLATPLTLGTNPATVATGIGGGRPFALVDSTNRLIAASTTGTTGIRVARANETCSSTLASMTWTAASPQITTTSAGVSGFSLAATATELLAIYGVSTTGVSLAKSNINLSGGFPAGNIHSVETATIGNDGVGIVYDTTKNSFFGVFAQLPGAALGAVGNDIKSVFGFPTDISSTGYSSWSVIDQTTSVTSTTAVPVMSLAQSSSGKIGFTYFHRDLAASSSATSRLYYGENIGQTAAPRFSRTLVYNFNEAAAASANYIGQYPDLSYDSNSNPAIAFIDSSTASTGLLMLALSSDNGLSFSNSRIDGSGTTSVIRFPSTNYYGSVLGIAYNDAGASNTGLKFARWTPGSGWRRYVVDGMVGATGTGCSTTETAGAFASFRWTSDGRPVIAYQSDPGLVKTVKIAYASEASTSATYTWTCLTVDAAVSVRGEGIDLALSSDDRPHIAAMGQTISEVRYITCDASISSCITSGPSSFVGERVALTGSSMISIASKPTITLTDAGLRYIAFHSIVDGLVLAEKSSEATSWSFKTLDSGATVNGSFANASGQYASMVLNLDQLPSIIYRSAENWLKWYAMESQ